MGGLRVGGGEGEGLAWTTVGNCDEVGVLGRRCRPPKKDGRLEKMLPWWWCWAGAGGSVSAILGHGWFLRSSSRRQSRRAGDGADQGLHG